MRNIIFLLLGCLSGLPRCVGTAHAQTPQTISYPNFASTAGLNLNGSATTLTTSDGVVIRLTPAVEGQAGTAFSNTRIQLGTSNTFSTFFQFRFSNPSVPPADGLVFVVQPVSSSLGGGGGGLGYAGISPSVGIEFDTFNNSEINNNHVAVDTHGFLQDFAVATPYDATSTVPLYLTGNGYMGTIAVGQTPAPVTFSASGGKPPYSWSISGAPGGLSLNAHGASATASGTPAAAGVYSFSVQVSDTQGISTGGSGFLSVLGVVASGLPDATAFASYSGTLSAVGGTAPYSFVVTGLPSGLSVTSDGQFRGQPATAGPFSLEVKVTDAGGLTATSSLSLNVKPAPALTLAGGALPAGLVNSSYSQSLAATGGGQPYNYAFASGSLPAGLRISSTGALSGTPTTPGSYSFLARVTDTTGASATGNFTLTIATPPVVLTTVSPLASGMVGVDYPPTSLTANGGVSPYTFSVPAGALPDGLTISSLGNLGGTPKTAGTSSFDVTVTDSTGQTGKGTLSLTIRPPGTDLILSTGTLSFAFPAGTTKIPAAQTVQVQSSDVSKPLAWSAASNSTWMQASATGTTPGEFSVSLTSAALSLVASDQPYQAPVTVTCTVFPCAGRAQLVNVQLSVNAAGAQLTLGSNLLTFSTSAAAPAGATQTLNVANTGGTSMGIGSVKCGAPWCNVTGIPAQVAPGGSSEIAVNVNPAGLSIGYYWTSVSFVTSAGIATVPVTLFITGNSGIILAPTGFQVSKQAGGVVSVAPPSFLITAGSATPVNWTASIVQGNFLVLANTAGTASSSQPGIANFSIDPGAAAALSPGVYYGLIRVSASGVANSPQDFVVVLNVTTSTQQTQPDPTPGGVLFVAQANSSPPPQSVTLYNSSGQAQGWQASVQTLDGSGWLSVSPAVGSTLAAAPAVTSVTADPSKLTPGIYRGSVNYAFAAIGVRSVNVTLVVQSPLAGAAVSELQSSIVQPRAQCAPTKIAATSTELVSNFSSPTAWPTELELTVVDDCGAASTSAQIVAKFSNGDPPVALTLADPPNGRYSATWTPRKVSSQVVINAQAKVTGFAPATVQLQGAVVPSGAPTVSPGAVLNLFNPVGGAPAAPGTLLQIGGTYLAAQPATSTANPLPKTLGGTSVLIGGIATPISSVGPGQITVQAPFELTPGQPYQVVVSANGALTTPEALQFTPTAPGLSVATAGYVTAIHQATGKPVTEDSPAKPGEAISVYLTGLGLTDVKVDSGAGGPSNPPANVLSLPAVTVDSVGVTITFAGLAPGQPGVYRIDFAVPGTAASGDLAVAVTQDGVTTNTGLLPVHK